MAAIPGFLLYSLCSTGIIYTTCDEDKMLVCWCHLSLKIFTFTHAYVTMPPTPPQHAHKRMHTCTCNHATYTPPPPNMHTNACTHAHTHTHTHTLTSKCSNALPLVNDSFNIVSDSRNMCPGSLILGTVLLTLVGLIRLKSLGFTIRTSSLNDEER